MTSSVREVYTWDHERLWRSIHAFSGSRSIADEAVTEAFAQARRHGDAIRDVTVFVWRSAFAVARSELARHRSESVAAAEDPAAEIHSRLDALNEGERQLLTWHHLGGWTAEEIAPALGTLATTVRLRLRRAERRARDLLGEGSDTRDPALVARSLDRFQATPSPDLWDDIVARADGDDLWIAPPPSRPRRPLVLAAGITAVVGLVGALVVVTTGSPSSVDDDPGGAPTVPTDLTATIGGDREVTLAVRDVDTGDLTGTFRLRLDETGGQTLLQYVNVDVAESDDVEFLVVEVDDEARSRTIHTTGAIGAVALTDATASEPFTARIVLTDPAGEAVQTSGTVLLTPEP